MKTGSLDRAIKEHKYDGRWGWGIIFARVLLGYLQQDRTVAGADLIIPMPMYSPANRERKGNDHAGWVIECAIDQDDVGYPFQLDPSVIVKTAATRKMVGHNAAERRQISEEIYAVLVVPDPSLVRGKTVVVFDDVFTAGDTLNAVGRRLLEAGAGQVIGLTMARAPWR
jgi:predicted amidophosphoribosyltransferase